MAAMQLDPMLAQPVQSWRLGERHLEADPAPTPGPRPPGAASSCTAALSPQSGGSAQPQHSQMVPKLSQNRACFRKQRGETSVSLFLAQGAPRNPE